nr:MAG TPA: hypothetical protein [Caudoviricetes sp.]
MIFEVLFLIHVFEVLYCIHVLSSLSLYLFSLF